jgi:hypothetical protein
MDDKEVTHVSKSLKWSIGLGVASALTAIMLLHLVAHGSKSSPAATRPNDNKVETEAVFLDRLVTFDRSSEISAWAYCTLEWSQGFDPIDYKISNVTITVEKHSVPGVPEGTHQLLERVYSDTWAGRTPGPPPIWTAGGIYTRDNDGLMRTGIQLRGREVQALPTIKLSWENEETIMAVLVDGQIPTVYRCKLNDQELKRVFPVDESAQKTLTAWYPRAFDVRDVYWSYTLIAHASFFDPKLKDSSSEGQLESIYSEWKRIRSSSSQH